MKMHNGTIVLVADGSKMLLLRNDGDAVSPELHVLAHGTFANPPSHEQMSDAPGVTFSSHGFGRSAYPQADPDQQAKDQFAADAASQLTELLKTEDGEVVVIAPPDTLGLLRRHYGPAVKARLIAEIDKDLTKHPVAAITQHVSHYRS